MGTTTFRQDGTRAPQEVSGSSTFIAAEGAPLVSVAMTAYNSAAWLPRSIGSVLQQQAEFAIEIVIGDDFSTDDTAAVLRSLVEQYPETIRVIPRTGKLGMQRNFFDTFEHCRGKYIAWLDADDYWTDPQKLTKQIAVLQADNSVSICCHYIRQVNAGGEVVQERCPDKAPGRYGIKDIVANNFVPSPSIVFRNGIHRSLPDSYFELTGLADWPVLLQSALVGDIVLLDAVMADYVLTPGSAYMSKGPLYQDAIDLEFYDEMEQILPRQWHRTIRAAKGKRHEAMAYHLVKQGNLPGARTAARKGFRIPYAMDNIVSKTKVLILLEVFGKIISKRGNPFKSR